MTGNGIHMIPDLMMKEDGIIWEGVSGERKLIQEPDREIFKNPFRILFIK